MTDTKKLSNVGVALTGGISGVAAVCISYPFDLLKTRAQFEVGKGNKMSLPAVARQIWVEGASTSVVRGVFGFYRGLDQLVPEAAFKTMLRFFTFKALQKEYMNAVGIDKMTVVGNLVCGALAGALETTVVVQPFERGKTLKADFKVPSQVYRSLYQSSGFGAMVRSIYTGYIPTLGRQVGNQASAFAFFYSTKDAYCGYFEKEDLNNLERLALGFSSGAVACCVTMPMDTAKTIAQKQTDPSKLQGTVSIMRQVVATRGFTGLYTGLAPRIGRVGLDRAFGFLAFEWISNQLLSIEAFQA